MEYTPKYKFSFDLPTVKNLLESGVHFGHQTKRWNPKMKKYIYTDRGGIHIIDISYTLPMLEEALNFLRTKAAEGNVIFVGTKRQTKELVETKAIECGAYYIVDRWPGGVLTNYEMTRKNLDRLNKLEKELIEGVEDRTKQEIVWMKVEWESLDRLYRGVKSMTKKPTAMVVFDTRLQKGAINEAKKLGIPIVGLVDTNCDPDSINYPIPSNDDALKALDLMVDLFAKAISEGNKGAGVKHIREDLSKVEVKRIVKESSLNVKKIIEENEEVEIKEKSVPKEEEKARVVFRVKEEVATEVEAEESLTGVIKVKDTKKTQPKKAESKKVSKVAKNKKTDAKKPTSKAKKANTTKKVELSDKIKKTLKSEKVSIEDLSKMSDEEILAIKGIGAVALKEIKKAIK